MYSEKHSCHKPAGFGGRSQLVPGWEVGGIRMGWRIGRQLRHLCEAAGCRCGARAAHHGCRGGQSPGLVARWSLARVRAALRPQCGGDCRAQFWRSRATAGRDHWSHEWTLVDGGWQVLTFCRARRIIDCCSRRLARRQAPGIYSFTGHQRIAENRGPRRLTQWTSYEPTLILDVRWNVIVQQLDSLRPVGERGVRNIDSVKFTIA